MSSYDPFSFYSENTVHTARQSLPYNPFALQKKSDVQRSRGGGDNSKANGHVAKPSKELRNQGVLRPSLNEVSLRHAQTITGSLPVHSDVVYAVVNALLEEKVSNHTEVEVKVGKLYDKSSGERVSEKVPVYTESVLLPEHHQACRFDSTVSRETFMQLNELLNKRHRDTRDQRQMVHYEHKKENDLYLENRVRQSRRLTQSATGERSYVVERTIRKERLRDINTISPMRAYDLRYSLSSEEPVQIDARQSRPRSEREKDRISYRFGHITIDITTVQSFDQIEILGDTIRHLSSPQTSYEVEVELEFPSAFNLASECNALRHLTPRPPTSQLHELVQELYDTVNSVLWTISQS